MRGARYRPRTAKRNPNGTAGVPPVSTKLRYDASLN
jgi:hypothetical protein